MPNCPKCDDSVAAPFSFVFATPAGNVLALYCPSCSAILGFVKMDD